MVKQSLEEERTEVNVVQTYKTNWKKIFGHVTHPDQPSGDENAEVVNWMEFNSYTWKPGDLEVGEFYLNSSLQVQPGKYDRKSSL